LSRTIQPNKKAVCTSITLWDELKGVSVFQLVENIFVAIRENRKTLLRHFYGIIKHAIIKAMKCFLLFLGLEPISLPYQAHSARRATIERYLLAAG
jgi:hypothetical protein